MKLFFFLRILGLRLIQEKITEVRKNYYDTFIRTTNIR